MSDIPERRESTRGLGDNLLGIKVERFLQWYKAKT